MESNYFGIAKTSFLNVWKYLVGGFALALAPDVVTYYSSGIVLSLCEIWRKAVSLVNVLLDWFNITMTGIWKKNPIVRVCVTITSFSIKLTHVTKN